MKHSYQERPDICSYINDLFVATESLYNQSEQKRAALQLAEKSIVRLRDLNRAEHKRHTHLHERHLTGHVQGCVWCEVYAALTAIQKLKDT